MVPRSVTPNGRYLIIDEWVDSGGDRNNIGVLDLSNNAIQGESDIEYLIQTDYRESQPKLSPDGKLLAYVSDRSGSLEIWVRGQPFADEESIRVSVSGDCRQPLWNTDSRELFYWDRDDDIIYSVQLDTSPELRAAQPVPLFSAEPYVFDSMGNYNYDRSRNRFLMIKKPPPGSKGNEIVLVENWQELMTRD